MSDNRLTYHSLKFENEVLAKKQEPKCRIWNNEEITHIIEQLCDPSGTYLRANRSLQHFRVLKALEVKELCYLDPYNNGESLKVIAFEDLFDELYWAWEQIGFAGWKPLHQKIREQGYYICILVVSRDGLCVHWAPGGHQPWALLGSSLLLLSCVLLYIQ